MRYYFKIGNLTVLIEYNREQYCAYFEKEFGLLHVSEGELTASRADICVTIQETPIRFLSEMKKVSKGFWQCESFLLQQLVAFRRKTWIKYNSLNNIELIVTYPCNEPIEKLFNPFFECRSIACLHDFFHNPFLLILQLNMLKLNSALFHSSSLVKRNEEIYLFTGEGQSGKSSLLKLLLDNYNSSFSAEDFSFVCSDGSVFGYPHMCRVKDKDFFRQIMTKSTINTIFDKLNYFAFHKVLRVGNGRHFSVSDYFSGKSFQERGNSGYVFELDRKCSEFSCEIQDLDSFVERQISVINNEFSNMVSVVDLADVLHKNGFVVYSFDDMINQIRQIYYTCFAKFKGLFILHLPFYSHIDEAADKLLTIVREKE